MIIIKDNPVLSLSIIEKIKKSFKHPVGVLVLPIALLWDGKRILEEITKKEMNIFELRSEPMMKEREWLFIAEDDIYYSKGDCSA